MGQAGHFGIQPFDDALLGLLQRARDADLLVDADFDLLFGYPAVLVLQDVERRLGVASGCRVVQRLGRDELAISAALHLGHLYQRVEFVQAAILRRGQASRQRKAVALQAATRSFVNRFQTRLGGFWTLRRERQGVEGHAATLNDAVWFCKFQKIKKRRRIPEYAAASPDMDLPCCSYTEKPFDVSGWDSIFQKNKKLSADGARDNHTHQGPTPSPSSCERFAITICRQLCAWPFGFGRFGSCETHIAGGAGARITLSIGLVE